MKQNKYFSFGRFARLFRNDLLINQKTYLFAIVGLGLAIYALTYISMYNGQNFLADNYSALFVCYLLGIGIFIGTAFPSLNNQIKTCSYLLIPGSNLEKYLVQFLLRIVILIPIALVIFWLSMHFAKASLVANPNIGFNAESQITDFHFSNLLDNEHLTIIDKLAIVFSIFSAASVLFAGSVYFTRFALVKTLIVSGIMFGAVFLSFSLFSHIFYPAETHGLHVELKTYQITKDLKNTQLFIYLIGGLSWIFFLVLGYFKLKEKEV